ncbi:diguanylate cyclase [Lysobacter korlensis]|uniref:diguanylate cyclase n=1 Tax=Lysobacter korlensis TaxID=553636 RepID=A0ABV6RLZ7_9GAMM
MSLPRISLALLMAAALVWPVADAAPSAGVTARESASAEPPAKPVDIATLLADRDRDTVPDAKNQPTRVRGVVTIASGVLRTRDLQVVVQDETGGITLFKENETAEIAVGDLVEATGRVSQFRGAVQLRDADIRRVGRANVPAPRELSVGQVNGWTHIGKRVRIEGVAGELSLDSFGLIRIKGDDGAAASIFIPAPVVESFDWRRYPPGTRVAATGVLSIYKPKWPYDEGFQVVVTSPADLQVLAAPAPAWQRWVIWGLVAATALIGLALLVFQLIQNRNKARQRELATLTTLSNAISAPDLSEEQLARHACEILTAYGIIEAAMVQVFDERGYLRQLATSTADPTLSGVLDLGEPMSVGGTLGEAHHLQIEARIAKQGLTLLAMHPLLAPSGTQGFLVALSPRKRKPSEMQERTLLAAVKLLAMAIENSKIQQRARVEQQELQQLVITDELTKLYNRRFLDEYLRVQIPVARRRGGGLAFLAIDIDHFKRVNDTYGHEAGDRVLAGVAAQIRQASRSSDLPVRLGGEEFLAVVAETEPAGAMVFAERLRSAIESQEFDGVVPGQVLRVTVSIGVALFGLHGEDAPSLLRASDEAMYVSKRGGRNRVTLAASLENPEQPHPVPAIDPAEAAAD